MIEAMPGTKPTQSHYTFEKHHAPDDCIRTRLYNNCRLVNVGTDEPLVCYFIVGDLLTTITIVFLSEVACVYSYVYELLCSEDGMRRRTVTHLQVISVPGLQPD